MRRLLAAVIVGLAAASPAAAQCTNAEKQALEAIDHAWSEATTRGDRAQLQSIIADDYEGATITGTVNKTTTIDDAASAAARTRSLLRELCTATTSSRARPTARWSRT